ncbi:hypothetical protein A2630_04340 [Candidatus Woesebacteria bacterium RIFCSPHIGHO2_01_FULL_44_10]|uniref:Uncharacterized protein n=1 Tax=Candidatus Woesebacteria bacterium RIFCSPLOWO2_01_FULL_44_14 TaxID=1802525 RepID=A0A1F8C340_9BACT|nr:MAG: hypothetical protein A2630_04340 [Candidatus Woesebacteria bacterium RIFCSPHIGHO2_01_FULL_44_10]OGM56009.1 MAG: hypothetical protein A3F62_03760 [Candidatus Woesebacteria bacterium RIFCSPHIGHO2_12_FULL_44_11]OGM70731.1 MAG: hypothetical protein A2975_02470 [Candidatus Woesebacteria bacterium RIFCSPLOWO2_01_FULL_44_14]
MRVEVDQSGRNDQTNKKTVLALANGIGFSIAISAREKRKVAAALKLRKSDWSTALTNIFVFSTLLYLLLKERIGKITEAIVDVEYPGKETIIKDRVMLICRKHGIAVQKDQFVFKHVGKKSLAHKLAYRVYKGIIKPGKTISAEEVLAEFGK